MSVTAALSPSREDMERHFHQDLVSLQDRLGEMAGRVETALTIDLMRQGFRVTEVEVELTHRATGTGLRAQLHRAHQLADVARALAARR